MKPMYLSKDTCGFINFISIKKSFKFKSNIDNIVEKSLYSVPLVNSQNT